MKALRLDRPQQFTWIDIPEPSAPAAGEAVVRVHRIGICGTDYGGYLGKMPFYSYPRIPGHELGVEVIAVVTGVTNVKPGDRCSVEPYINCQTCYSCRRGFTNCCENHQTLGVMCDGGMAEKFLLPARKLHVSTELSYDQLALVETLAIGCHAVDRAAPKAGETVLVIGAGPIGLEMAQAHVRLGCKVTVVEGARALGREDPDAAALVLSRLRAEGVEIVEDCLISQVSQASETGAITLTAKDGRQFTGSQLLVAVGRTPNTSRLNLEAAGIAHSRTGITVDNRLRTTNRRVYAIGDVAGGLQFTHVAGYHAGLIIREALFGLPAKVRTDHIPRATYTAPELAQIGLTEAEARRQYGTALEVARVDLAHNDRAIATAQAEGFLKLMILKGRPIGVTIVGPQAGEQIALWSMAMANRMKLSAMSGMIAPYPTLSELSKRAIGAYFSPRLFANLWVKRVVRWVQRVLP